MTVKDCTKEELIFIIERLTRHDKYKLNLLLNDLEYKREMKKIDEEKKWADVAYKKRGEALELLKPFGALGNVPDKILKKASELMKEAEEADKKWAKIANIKI